MGLTRDAFNHIREDIRNAMVENRNDDPSLMPDLVMYLIDQLGEAAKTECSCLYTGDPGQYDGPERGCRDHGDPSYWSTEVLERAQLRALSQIPFGEADDCDQSDEEDHRD